MLLLVNKINQNTRVQKLVYDPPGGCEFGRVCFYVLANSFSRNRLKSWKENLRSPQGHAGSTHSQNHQQMAALLRATSTQTAETLSGGNPATPGDESGADMKGGGV